MSYALRALECSTLGRYTRLVLEWRAERAEPQPGQYLLAHDGTRWWPMRRARAGRLELLGNPHTRPSTIIHADVVGHPFKLTADALVLLAEGLGLAPLIHLAETLRGTPTPLTAYYELDDRPAFRPRPSRFLIEGLPPGMIAAIPLLEDWGIASRLASRLGAPGCFDGGLHELLGGIAFPRKAMLIAMGSPTFLDRLAKVAPLSIALETGAKA